MAQQSVLTIIQNFCQRRGLPKPTTIQGNQNTTISQLLGLLQEELDDLTTRHDWPAMRLETTFTSIVGQESQGQLDTLFPGYIGVLPNTFWNVTRRIPTNGSISAQEYQAIKAWGSPQVMTNLRYAANQLFFVPAPTAAEIFRTEYLTKYMVNSTASDNVSPVVAQYFTKDSDTPAFPDYLLLFGLTWRWKKEKGLAYGDDFNIYEDKVKWAMSKMKVSKPIDMAQGLYKAAPAIGVQPGNWNVH